MLVQFRWDGVGCERMIAEDTIAMWAEENPNREMQCESIEKAFFSSDESIHFRRDDSTTELFSE